MDIKQFMKIKRFW